MENDKQPMIGALSIFRLAAVVHIVLWTYYTPDDDSNFLAKRWKWFFSWGLSEIGFLVVLSGFTLGYNYSMYVSSMDTKEFYVKRLCRMPLVLAAMVLPAYTYPVAALGSMDKVTEFVSTLVGAQGWISSHAFSLNIPLWAVSVFVFLYILFPMLLKFVDSLQQVQRKHKIGIIVGLWVFSYLLVLIMANIDDGLNIWSTTTPLLYLPAYLMGIMTGELFVNRAPYEETALQTTMARFAGTGTLVVMLVCFFFTPTFQFVKREDWQNWFYYWNHVGTWTGMQCFMLYWICNGKDVLGMVLNVKIIYTIGTLAPCVYLFFHPVWTFAHHFDAGVQLCFWVSLGVLVFITHMLVERPFYSWATESYRASKATEL